MTNKTHKPLEITPISAWVEEYEIVHLPYAQKNVGLRKVDVMDILMGDGQIPNVLLSMIQGDITPTQTQNVQMEGDDFKRFRELLDKLARACFANPPIVDTMEEVQEGKGILSSMIPFNDKSLLIAYCMGGRAQFENATKFLEQQEGSVVAVQPSDNIPSESEPDS